MVYFYQSQNAKINVCGRPPNHLPLLWFPECNQHYFLIGMAISFFFSSWWEYQLKRMNSLCWLFIFKNGFFSSTCKYNRVKYAYLSDAVKYVEGDSQATFEIIWFLIIC